jgi:hypothetical protein
VYANAILSDIFPPIQGLQSAISAKCIHLVTGVGIDSVLGYPLRTTAMCGTLEAELFLHQHTILLFSP